VPANIAAVIYPAGRKLLRIDEFDLSARKHYGAGLIVAAGRPIVQSFVGPLMIKHMPETVELSLLQAQREGIPKGLDELEVAHCRPCRYLTSRFMFEHFELVAVGLGSTLKSTKMHLLRRGLI
jgi:hypothetical protein